MSRHHDQESGISGSPAAKMKEEFSIDTAAERDLPELLAIMEEAAADPVHPEWFISDDEAYMRSHLTGKGFIAAARSREGEAAGFFMIKFPQPGEEQLADFLDFSEEQKGRTAVMDSAVVRKKYRGHGLQKKLLKYCEEVLEKEGYRYFLCTVHPDNVFSLKNMENGGFRIVKRVNCYGGKDRFILQKNR